ncbi:glycosyltransferase [Geminocystis sp. NIES-3709]|uniref:glycosyltransferase n=1 Tax=Geminocystis sp. NIES-3709 TaxID=1617448 RepID=UPI0005FC9498|nr:glycosyltransferase [Geminocystis sp. NIES-3709]BAQ66445.1 glycosyltransferase [Geminocystis sp. NIES-3709]
MNSKTLRLVQKHFSFLHIWIPKLFECKGGIQTYSIFFVEAIQNCLPNTNYELFIKHDKKTPSYFNPISNIKFHYTGKILISLRTLVFALQLFVWGILKKPNLIISTHLNFTPVAYHLKRWTGISYWIVAHGIEAWNVSNPRLQKALKNANLILAVSNYTRERLIKEQSLNPDTIVVLPNTFDAEKFKIAIKPDYLLERYQLKPQQLIILTVARLSSSEQYKGFDKIIQCLPTIIKVIPHVHYILVGKGDDLSRIKKLIRDLNLESYVTLTGFVSDEELCDHYNLCDMFAMPSKGEGFGIVYLEALACGKPTLGGNQDAAIDALCHGELGALVNPDDIEEIATTLISILQGNYDHPLMYHPQKLREKVIEIYGFDKFKKTLDGYLSNVTEN